MTTPLSCPSCSKRLRVPEQNLGKKVRCPACAAVFVATAPPEGLEPEIVLPRSGPPPPPPRNRPLRQNPRTGAPQGFAPTPAAEPADGRAAGLRADPSLPQSADPESAAPPLGPEPAPARYGLLTAAAWGLILLALLVFGWGTVEALKPAGRTTPALMVIGCFANLAWAGCTAFALLRCVRCLERMDAAATWLSWRSDAVSRRLDRAPGGSLPYILPWTVAGGAFTVLYLVKSREPPLSELARGFPFAWFLLLFLGGLLVLAGLACGDLRLFLWRMAQFGRTLPRRRRGEEVTIGPPVRAAVPHPRVRSARHMATILALALSGYLFLGLLFLLAPLPVGLKLAGFLMGFLTFVGGPYVLYGLTKIWSDALAAWRATMLSIGLPMAEARAGSRTRAFRIAGWILGGGILGFIALAFILFLLTSIRALQGVDLSGLAFLFLGMTLPAAVAFLAFFLAALKTETHEFAQAASAIPVASRIRPERDPLATKLAFGILGVGGIQFVIFVIQMISSLQASASIGGGGVSGVGLGPEIFQALVAALFVCAGVFYPNVFLALLLLDLDRAAGSLEACGEAGEAG